MKWLFAIFTIIIGLDQSTKWLVREHIATNDKIVLIDGFFNLTHVQNTGAAFGLFQNLSPTIRNPLFFVTSLVAFIILFYLFINTPKKDWFLRATLTLISAGALGNVTDRIIRESVTDFLQVYYKSYYWPSFNVADSCISIGVFLLFIDIFFFRKKTDFPFLKEKESSDKLNIDSEVDAPSN